MNAIGTLRKTPSLAAALIAWSGATASAAEQPIKVDIGGYFYGYLAGVSQESAAGTPNNQPGYGSRNVGVFRKSRLEFNGSANLDNGVKAGFRIDLRGESNSTDQIERSYLFFDTPFGLAQLGKVRGAAFAMHYTNPDIQSAESDPWNLNFGDFNGMKTPLFNTVYGGASTYIETGYSEKIVYYTPRFSGAQLGISYAPDGCAIGAPSSNYPNNPNALNPVAGVNCGGGIGNGFMASNNIGQQSQTLGLGANYVRKIGPVDLALSAGYMSANLEAQTFGQDFKNEKAWNAGAQVSWAGFTLGGGYAWDNLGITASPAFLYNVGANAKNWAIGLTYQWERWRGGINYVATKTDSITPLGFTAGQDKYQGVEIGGGYTLGPGIELTAGAEWQQWKTTQSVAIANLPLFQNQGWVYQVGTVLRF